LAKLHRESFGYLSGELLENEVRQLLRLKFVTSPRRGLFQKLNGWNPLHERIVAVELKLCRITEALDQASSNRAFATESYAALPAALAYRIAGNCRAAEFRKNGVGLLAVSQNSCRRLLPGSCPKGVADEVLQAHCVERFWRTTDKPS